MLHDRSLSQSMNPIFERYFDGLLFNRYIGVKEDIPKHLSLIATIMSDMDLEKGVSIDAIIKEMLMAGYREQKAYNLVLEAVDESYLIPAEPEVSSYAAESE